MEVSCASKVAVVGDEILKAFIDFAERGRCIEHCVSLADGGDMWHRVSAEGIAGRIKGGRTESVMKDLVGGGWELDVCAVQIFTIVQAEINVSVEVLEVVLELVMTHGVRVRRLVGRGGVVHVGDWGVIQLKLVSTEHVNVGGLGVFGEVDLVLLVVDTRSLIASLHIIVILLWSVDSVYVATWSSDGVCLRCGKTIAWCSFLAVLSIVLGSNIFPTVCLLHVLLAVRFTLGSVCARLEVAFVKGRSRGVLVIVMSVHLLLRWPTVLVILAGLDWAFPGTGVRLFVFCEVTRAFEFLVATRFTAALGSELSS